ncbi:hypothetical protein LSH36_154g03041 [Paralvinella palmiformis]|uniref:Saccharopine dehydrogenase NADP binding domain-containing protein n=1 Tax=Paralvinella palmiformis TaxID=53620 RepID=A0AAD9JVA4_9ANNE|nr:hypothetical protein LSH36_154g03041 [Paralvinella palmiformis]
MASGEGGRKFDMIVFGASGFTGQFVVEEIARTQDEEGKLNWAIAGRSMSKLQNVLKEATKHTGKDLENLDIIIADVTSENSLHEMCKQTKVILNCVGPYQLYGDPVVKACIENKTHHIDISGEPLFLENTQLVYDGKAKEAGIYVLECCGFDSIPSDMGIVFLKNQFKGDLSHVEGYMVFIYDTLTSNLNAGTWKSAVYSYSNADKCKAVCKQLKKEPLPKGKYGNPKRSLIFYSKDTNGWCVHFMGVDRSVVLRSQRYNYEERKERPIQFNAYMKLANIIGVMYMMFIGALFGILTRFSLGIKILEKFPKVMSLGFFDPNGPSRKQIAGASFTLDLFGYGYKDKLDDLNKQHEEEPTEKIVAKVSGPDAGYVTTPICMVQAAYTLLKEQKNLPQGGGVFTPGAAFSKTSLVDRLNKHGLKFEIIQK